MDDKDELKPVDGAPEAVLDRDAIADGDEVEPSATDDALPDGDVSQTETEQLQAEIEALKNEVLRARADVENIRKRATRDVEAAHKYGLERLVSELLPVKDSIELGLSAAASASDVESLTEGMELTVKMFNDFLDKLGITELDPADLPFDPEFHQAMTVEESAEAAPGTVLKVMQKGFLLNDRLVRPALVIVAKSAAENT